MAWSSRIGDPCLIAAICAGSRVLKFHQGEIPGFFGSSNWEVVALVSGLAISFAWLGGVFLRDRVIGLSADNYHNGGVVPVMVYLVMVSVAPLLFTSGYATANQWWLAFGLVAIFVATAIIDGCTGRFEQTMWIKNHKALERQQATINAEDAVKAAAKTR